jgi:hypothetical protein
MKYQEMGGTGGLRMSLRVSQVTKGPQDVLFSRLFDTELVERDNPLTDIG